MSTKFERKTIYNTTRWRKLREKILEKNDGLCANCKRRGYTNDAHIIHHIKPWKDGKDKTERYLLIWDEDNLEPVCNSCHNNLHSEMVDINKDSNDIWKMVYSMMDIQN